MKRSLMTWFAVATCATGCSGADQATEADYDDVAQALSSVVVTDNGGGEVGAMIDVTAAAAGTPGLTLKVSANGKYTDSHLGLDYAYTVNCADAKGAAQTKCDKTTDKADVEVKWSGELALPHITAKVDREGSWKVTDVQSNLVNIAGDSDFTLDLELQSLFRAATRSYHIGYAADYANVKLDRAAHRITGGSVTYVIDAERKAQGPRRTSEANFHINGVLTFQADGSAKLSLDKSFDYTIDTTTGNVEKQ